MQNGPILHGIARLTAMRAGLPRHTPELDTSQLDVPQLDAPQLDAPQLNAYARCQERLLDAWVQLDHMSRALDLKSAPARRERAATMTASAERARILGA